MTVAEPNRRKRAKAIVFIPKGFGSWFYWKRARDLNPRSPCGLARFQGRCIQPDSASPLKVAMGGGFQPPVPGLPDTLVFGTSAIKRTLPPHRGRRSGSRTHKSGLWPERPLSKRVGLPMPNPSVNKLWRRHQDSNLGHLFGGVTH